MLDQGVPGKSGAGRLPDGEHVIGGVGLHGIELVPV